MATYNVTAKMPDGNTTEFPPMTGAELVNYLDAVKAEYDQDPESLALGGTATATYSAPGDTTITWTPIEASDG
jgi:hypothetical protein